MSLRNSRSYERNGSSRRRESRYESTQSMDRYQRDRSPVFYLNPTDWIRTEGSSPLPYKEKQQNPMKLLDSLGINLDILTESEENLNSELEQINSHSLNMKNSRNKSDPVRYQTPTLELIRESSQTPEPPSLPRISRSCTPGIRSRSSTPGPSLGKTLLDRQRKTAIPILCSRSVRMVTFDNLNYLYNISSSPRLTTSHLVTVLLAFLQPLFHPVLAQTMLNPLDSSTTPDLDPHAEDSPEERTTDLCQILANTLKRM